MLPQNKPDRIRILFDDHRLVANAGLLLPATLARHLGLRGLVDHHLDLGGAPGRANTGVIRTTRIGSRTMRAATVSCLHKEGCSPSNVSTSPPREPISGSIGHPEPSAERALPLQCARRARMAATYPSGRTMRHCGATALGWPPRQLKRRTS